ncbi:MAG: hypothetical protein ACREMJ_04930, partial [Gemmatimonadales bacterium]
MARFSVLGSAVALAALAALAAGAAAAQTPAEPSHYAIRNARIVTAPGRAIARGTVVMNDGLITAVGANVTPPAGAWVIDGTGLTVYPGLVDAMSTLGLPASLRLPEPRAGGGGGGGGRPGGQPSNASYSRGPDDRPAT